MPHRRPRLRHPDEPGRPAQPPHPAQVLAQGAIWIGTLVFVLGAGAARGLVSGGAIIACYGAAMIITGTVAWVHHHAGARPD